MNQDHASSRTWPQHFEQDPMVTTSADDDFTAFLDLGPDFTNFDGLDHGSSGLDTPMGRLGFQQLGIDTQDDGMNVDMGMDQPVALMSMHGVHDGTTGPGIQRQVYQHQQGHSQMMSSHKYQVPLTPVSSEMHAAKYMQHLDGNGQLVYDRNQISFTPLVSPAQTPLDSTFSMPEYMTANDFFSPLTSPAIDAQHVLGSTGPTASPVDLNDASTNRTTQPAAKRSRRKPSSSARTPARSVKQSPAMKPQSRRRPPSMANLPTDILGMIENSAILGTGQRPNSGSTKAIVSSDSSVSPEPLSEALMPPPAIPRSSGRSPQTGPEIRPEGGNEPATPATLMRIPSNPGKTVSGVENDMSIIEDSALMQDIVLPDSAVPTFHSPLPPLDTSMAATSDGQRTPTMSAKSAKFSASNTPRMSAMAPQTLLPDDPSRLRGSDSRTSARSSKKRQGTASAAISPALRPKISPSINPLVPSSGPGMPVLSAETSALYLASKSNYQNILEGTHLPGVSYPEALAENLSSKRTSHKIAEQGRRNRINTALKEIEALLPASILATGKKDRSNSNENEEGDKSSSIGQGASKASTVEMAIVYIKNLQAELKEAKEKLEVAEKKIIVDENSNSSQGSE